MSTTDKKNPPPIRLPNPHANLRHPIYVMAANYPSELIWRWMLPDGTRILIRPIRPEDRWIEREFVRNLSSESRYFRFMSAVNELSEAMLNRFTRIDYARELALIAVVTEDAHEKEIAVVRYVAQSRRQKLRVRHRGGRRLAASADRQDADDLPDVGGAQPRPAGDGRSCAFEQSQDAWIDACIGIHHQLRRR